MTDAGARLIEGPTDKPWADISVGRLITGELVPMIRVSDNAREQSCPKWTDDDPESSLTALIVPAFPPSRTPAGSCNVLLDPMGFTPATRHCTLLATGSRTVTPKRSDMTPRQTAAIKPEHHQNFELPDPPDQDPNDMTSFNHLNVTGSTHHLVQHLGNLSTTLVAGEHYISPVPTQDMTGLHFPDLLIAFGVDPAAYYRSNAYIISEQGKPPDFVLEIASRSTGRQDVGEKRLAYADLGIPEYWRFDETSQFHGTRLAGDRLVDGRYEPIPIETVEDGILQSYSSVLDLFIRWEHGELAWHDPETGRHIATFATERQARLEAQARVRELEAELDRRPGEDQESG